MSARHPQINEQGESMLITQAELKPLTNETIERLRAATGDPIDAMRLAADMYATNAYLTERAIAIATGQPGPKPPKPISRYLRSFALDLRMRIAEMLRLFSTDELGRLRALGSAIEKRLEDDQGDLIGSIVLLLAMAPADVVLWVRAHLGDIEARLAS
jgi:hypothetical protein